ncbi:uncharacterized protein LOC132192830 [Neocloeon triangulifer]|uniref:uncharacterized protein LOC132192830 n=1 Tax=Neocloeon triangulifer TaxID=2078957 RepID=UPI00286ED15E|nr:uncharacterized protein LOC132192830 [Neocloeon triangulifer]
MAKEGWSRPASAPAKIYSRENGVVIRDVTPDLDDFVIQHMLENFARDSSPLAQSFKPAEDPDSIADFATIWKNILPQRVSLVALAEGTPCSNLEPVSVSNPPTIIGVSVLTLHCKGEKSTFSSQCNGAAIKKIFGLWNHLNSLVNIFERFNIDHYLDSVGFFAVPIMHEKGIFLMLMKARIDLCRYLKIPLTRTINTEINSQKVLAAKAGFEVLLDKHFEELKGPDGKMLFPEMAQHKSIQMLSARIR